jgi:hypothetical protein
VQDRALQTQAAFASLAEARGLRAGGAFPFDYQHLAFYGGSPGQVTLWAATSVHAGRVRGVFEGGWRYKLSMALELFQNDTLVASDTRRFQHVLSAEIPSNISDGFPLQVMVRVPPGRYDYRIRVTDLNWTSGRSMNEKTGTVIVPPIDSEHPVLSSIAIAADSGGTWSPVPGVALKLNAAAIVQRRARPFIYYEVYGLTPGSDYRGEIRLVSTWAGTGAGETFTGPHQPFQMQYRGTTPADPLQPIRSVFRLDMKDADVGPYEVRVRVTDLTTGQVSGTRRARLKVREVDRTRPVVPITEIESVTVDREEPGM